MLVFSIETIVDQIAAAQFWMVAETHLGWVIFAVGGATPALHSFECVPLAEILLANLATELEGYVLGNRIFSVFITH